ncbi:uncharacterized protein BYT42DRAFT_565862 [Radiomyces spectabilis]|uniref:uncharacterized protein n=1 Tax=Radiomyces spectabilis TaxID=64574 RepID=UPI00221E8E88|nr:uncharacterized protein BYT42DRAFT_565862 [Radiomyces spectabilis]KAI8381252.1 hypothetical protein BYT42DRAFT_565862 [Radiomyces spectabilis]
MYGKVGSPRGSSFSVPMWAFLARMAFLFGLLRQESKSNFLKNDKKKIDKRVKFPSLHTLSTPAFLAAAAGWSTWPL